jgi:ribosomal protein L11 methylase PrmA
VARIQTGGVLVVAGILDREFAVVQKAYEAAGLRLISNRREQEWRSGTFKLVDPPPSKELRRTGG